MQRFNLIGKKIVGWDYESDKFKWTILFYIHFIINNSLLFESIWKSLLNPNGFEILHMNAQ